MKLRIISIILSVVLFSQIGFAQLCSILKDVRVGEDHTLALDENNNLWSCGGVSYCYYQLGLGEIYNVLSLQRVLCGDVNTISGYLENIKSFDAGWYHSLAVDLDGTCWSWGHNTSGQLGNGDEGSSNVPVKVHGLNNNPNGLQHIEKISAGRSGTHSLAVDSNGYVTAFGYNYYGQCGDNTNTDRSYPVLVLSTGEDPNFTYLGQEAFIIDVDAGMYHSLALERFEDGGHVFQWGQNVGSIPQRVPGLSNIIDIATCGYSLAVDEPNGNVWYWTTGGTPTKIAGGEMGTTYLENIVKVAAGGDGYYAPILCAALDSNGNVWEWSGSSGSPVKVVDGEQYTSSGHLEDIIAFDVGFYDQRIAIDEYGRGFGWGSNEGGALGIGTSSTPTEPTEMLCAEISPSVEFSVSYEIEGGLDPNCVYPFYDIIGNYLVFTIAYSNPITNPSDPNYVGTISDVNIINELPLEVEYYSSSPNGVYDSNTRQIKWDIDDLSPGEDGILTLTVMVNDYAKPCGEIIDFAHLTGDGYYTYTDVNVPVCPYGGDIVYVNDDANGFNNGTSWQDAYTDLQDAFAQAHSGCTEITAIWIAGGRYTPVKTTGTNYQDETFEIVNGVALIGHFSGNKDSPDERNFADANNETILDGRIGTTSYDAVYNVITAEDINDGLVDGVTVKNAYNYGMYIYNTTIGVVNCKFKGNNNYGIYADYWSYPYIYNCLFMDNGSYSVYASTSEPDISYCVFDGNDTTSYGLYLANYAVSNISNSEFQNHNSDAIYGGNATIIVSDCNISSNGTAVGGSSSTLDISACNLSLNSTAISGSSGTVTVNGCSLSENSTAVQGSSSTVNINDCRLSENSTAIQGSTTTMNISDCNMYLNSTAINGSSTSTVNLEECKIYQNNYCGVDASGSTTLNCKKTIFEDNTQNGIRLSSGCNLDIENSVIRTSGSQGIYLSYGSNTKIINNWIHKNGESSSAAGIYLENQIGTPLIRNNSICNNGTYGIERNATGAEPNILNCIIYGNDTNDIYRPSGTFSKVKYCLLQRAYTGTDNIIGDPCFANYSSNENDLHISKNSICKDAGYLYGVYGENETDIDGEARVKNGRIDVGADERYSSPADFDNSNIVNWLDYRYLANDWKTSQSDYSLDDDNDIDVYDLALFCADWLWQDATEIGGWMLWTAGEEMMMMGMSGGSSLMSMSVSDEPAAETADTLMLTTAAESVAKQPARLAAKSQKFYDITPDKTISAKQRELESLKAQRAERMTPSKSIEPMSLSSNLAVESVETVQETFDVNEILNWLDNLWQTDSEIRNSIDANDWQEFINSIKSLE